MKYYIMTKLHQHVILPILKASVKDIKTVCKKHYKKTKQKKTGVEGP